MLPPTPFLPFFHQYVTLKDLVFVIVSLWFAVLPLDCSTFLCHICRFLCIDGHIMLKTQMSSRCVDCAGAILLLIYIILWSKAGDFQLGSSDWTELSKKQMLFSFFHFAVLSSVIFWLPEWPLNKITEWKGWLTWSEEKTHNEQVEKAGSWLVLSMCGSYV